MEVAEYFSKDFEWEELKAEVENDPSFRYHLLPFECSNPSSQAAAEEDSIAWKKFHIRHSSGKFFKVSTFPVFIPVTIFKIFNRIFLGFLLILMGFIGCLVAEERQEIR